MLFVAVAVLSLVTYGFSAPSLLTQLFASFSADDQLTITNLPLSPFNDAAKATTLMAVACSTYSFWPEYKAFFVSSRG